MIVIRNIQRLVKIDIDKLRADAQKVLDALKYSDYDIGILLIPLNRMQEYNLQYRRIDKPTDILSFSYHTDLKPGQRIRPKYPEETNLGDLLLCPAYIRDDLPRWNQTFEMRLKVLLVHGICHLLGYDHKTDAQYRVMHAKERALLKKII